MFGDGCAMGFCRIAFVDGPVIDRILVMGGFHEVVAPCLRENRGRSDVGKSPVALDISSPRQIAVGLETISVDNNGSGSHFQTVESPVHGENRCVEDIDAVDFRCID